LLCDIVGKFIERVKKGLLTLHFQGNITFAGRFKPQNAATAKILKKLMGGNFVLQLQNPPVEPVVGKLIPSVDNYGGGVILEMKGPAIRKLREVSGNGNLFFSIKGDEIIVTFQEHRTEKDPQK